MAAAETKTKFGIPVSEFIEDIEAFAPTAEKAQELYREKYDLKQKYRLLEQKLIESQLQLKKSRPSVLENIDAIEKLEQRSGSKEMTTRFQLADSLYSKANFTCDGTVYLWLGADLMVEYSYKEAKDLLYENLKQLDNQINEGEEKLSFLREQIITTEVTISRTVNHLLQMNRKK